MFRTLHDLLHILFEVIHVFFFRKRAVYRSVASNGTLSYLMLWNVPAEISRSTIGAPFAEAKCTAFDRVHGCDAGKFHGCLHQGSAEQVLGTGCRRLTTE